MSKKNCIAFLEIKCCIYIFVQQPASRKDAWNVDDHKHHGSPVHPFAVNVVIVYHHIFDDGVLDPLHGVGSRIQHEDGQDQPSPRVQYILRLYVQGIDRLQRAELVWCTIGHGLCGVLNYLYCLNNYTDLIQLNQVCLI